jgi:hypothetical protein
MSSPTTTTPVTFIDAGASSLNFRRPTNPAGTSKSLSSSLMQKGLRRHDEDAAMAGLMGMLIPVLADPTHSRAKGQFSNILNRLGVIVTAEDFADPDLVPLYVAVEAEVQALFKDTYVGAPALETAKQIVAKLGGFVRAVNTSKSRSRLVSALRSAFLDTELQAPIREAMDLPACAPDPAVSTIAGAVKALAECDTPLDSDATTACLLRVFDSLTADTTGVKGALRPASKWDVSKVTRRAAYDAVLDARNAADTDGTPLVSPKCLSSGKRNVVECLKDIAMGRTHKERPIYLYQALVFCLGCFEVSAAVSTVVPLDDVEVTALLAKDGPAWADIMARWPYAGDKHTAEGGGAGKKGGDLRFGLEGSWIDPATSLALNPRLVNAYVVSKAFLSVGVCAAALTSDQARAVAKHLFVDATASLELKSGLTPESVMSFVDNVMNGGGGGAGAGAAPTLPAKKKHKVAAPVPMTPQQQADIDDVLEVMVTVVED